MDCPCADKPPIMPAATTAWIMDDLAPFTRSRSRQCSKCSTVTNLPPWLVLIVTSCIIHQGHAQAQEGGPHRDKNKQNNQATGPRLHTKWLAIGIGMAMSSIEQEWAAQGAPLRSLDRCGCMCSHVVLFVPSMQHTRARASRSSPRSSTAPFDPCTRPCLV